jgi:DNA-binding MarR family transcriptional regulator
MESVVKSFQKYIYDNVGISVTGCHREKSPSLPFFMLDEYDIYKTYIIDNGYVLLVSKIDQEISPAKIKKHVEMARDKFAEDVIFVHPSISSYNRKRLIEYKIPFVIPGNQMYLPELMIDLREHFYAARSSKPQFSPSTQAVVLYILHHFRAQPFFPSELTKKVGYTNTTMTRAFDEIEAANIGRNDMEGRQRSLWIQDDKRQLWDKVMPYLKSPVQRSMWVRTLPEELQKYQAGETALSRYSMLGPPRHKTFAAKKNDWDFYKRRDSIEEVKSKEDAEFQLQIWNYDPKLFAKGGTVDKFSLYLSFKDNEDERIQGAAEEMMESIEW